MRAEIEKAVWGSPAGKAMVAKRLVAMIPEHRTYVEPFGGAGSVLLTKEPSEREVIGDIDPDIASAWRALKSVDAEMLKALRRKPWIGDRAVFDKLLKLQPSTDVGKLHRFAYLSVYSHMYGRKSFNAGPRGQGHDAGVLKRIEAAAPRARRLIVHEGDYADLLKKYDAPDTFFFLDPPYTGYNAGVREGAFDEQRFFELLKGLKGKWLLTYGSRGSLPALVRKAGFSIATLETSRQVRTARGVGGDARLRQLVASNYTPVQKSETRRQALVHADPVAALARLEAGDVAGVLVPHERDDIGRELVLVSKGAAMVAHGVVELKGGVAFPSGRIAAAKLGDKVCAPEHADSNDPVWFYSLALHQRWEPKTVGVARRALPVAKRLSDAQRADYERENAAIAESKKGPAAAQSHRFKAAKWTHPNGHPRCIVCGAEETVSGFCNSRDKDKAAIAERERDEVEKGLPKPMLSPGGKKTFARALLKLFPEHRTYVEPYVGGGSLFWAKEPSECEVISDLDPDVVCVYEWLQKASDSDLAWMRAQPWKASALRWRQLKSSNPSGLRERAYRSKYLNMHSQRGGRLRFFNPPGRTVTGQVFLANLEKYRDRLKGVTIFSRDALEVMRKYDGADTFAFLDPPWQREDGMGRYNWDVRKFNDAVAGLTSKALVVIQGKLDLPKWRRVSMSATSFAGTDAPTVVDVWRNYDRAGNVSKADTHRQTFDDETKLVNAFESKLDGGIVVEPVYPGLAAVVTRDRDGGVTITHDGQDVSTDFAAIARAVAGLGHALTLTGYLVDHDAQGNPRRFEKAVWSTAYVNRLPDSAFLYIAPGGKKDDEGKTVPRSLRRFPVRDHRSDIDPAHARNAIARIPQSNAEGLTPSKMRALQDEARALLAQAVEKRDDSRVRLYVNDVRRWKGEDVSGRDWADRAKLRLGLFGTRGTGPLANVPGRVIHSRDALAGAITWAKKLPTSSAVAVQCCDGSQVAKLSIARIVNAVVYSSKASEQRGRVAHLCAVGPLSEAELSEWGDTVKLNGRAYAPIGATSSTGIDAASGDVLRVEVAGLQVIDTPGNRGVTWSSPMVAERVRIRPDTVAAIRSKARADETVRKFEAHVSIIEKRDDEQYVLGVVLEPNDGDGVPLKPDAHNDVYSADDVRDAAFRFMLDHNKLGIMHERVVPRTDLAVVENYIAPIDFTLNGQAVRKGSWLIGARVLDPDLWVRVKSGELNSWSVQGKSMSRPEDVKA